MLVTILILQIVQFIVTAILLKVMIFKLEDISIDIDILDKTFVRKMFEKVCYLYEKIKQQDDAPQR